MQRQTHGSVSPSHPTTLGDANTVQGLDINPNNLLTAGEGKECVWRGSELFVSICNICAAVFFGPQWFTRKDREGQRGEEMEVFFYHQSVSFREQGRRHSCPRSWIHLFDTLNRKNKR